MPALFAFRPLVLLDLVPALLPLVLPDLVRALLPLVLLDLVLALLPLVPLDLVPALLPLVLLDLVPALLPLVPPDLVLALLPLVLLDLVPALLPLVPPDLVLALLPLVPLDLVLALLPLVPLDLVPVLVDPARDPEHTKGTTSTPIFQEAQPRNNSPDSLPPETETPQGRPTRKVIPFQFFSSHGQEKRPRTTLHHLTLTDHQARCTVTIPTTHRSTNLESLPET